MSPFIEGLAESTHHFSSLSWPINYSILLLPSPSTPTVLLLQLDRTFPLSSFLFVAINMAEERHRHHLFHRKEEEDRPSEVVYSESGYVQSGEGFGAYSQTTEVVEGEQFEDYRKEEKEHKHKEHLGEIGAVAAGAFALHEKHKAKKDPEHAHRHKLEEEIAAAAAVGAGGYAFHEHHEKKEAKHEAEEAEGKKHHFF